MADEPYFLLYYSAASHLMSDAELEEILAVSRRTNPCLGISGMLLYGEGGFVQLLEGERERVRALFDRIARDPRHSRVFLALDGRTPARQFPDWSMGFRRVDRRLMAERSGSSHLMDASVPLDEIWKDPHPAYRMLLSFRQ